MRNPLTVADVMTRDVITVPVDLPFKAVAALFAEHGVSAFPVTEEGALLVGIVSETDLLHKQEHPETRHRGLSPALRQVRRKARATTVADLMTSPMVTIEVGSTLSEAARLMAAREITRLVVLDGEWMAGIVTRSDLLRAFLDSDRVLLARVRREAVERALWDDPFGVEVEVADGVVTLTGELPHRSMIPVAAQAIREVDGVVGVVNRLSSAFDDTAPASGPFY